MIIMLKTLLEDKNRQFFITAMSLTDKQYEIYYGTYHQVLGKYNKSRLLARVNIGENDLKNCFDYIDDNIKNSIETFICLDRAYGKQTRLDDVSLTVLLCVNICFSSREYDVPIRRDINLLDGVNLVPLNKLEDIRQIDPFGERFSVTNLYDLINMHGYDVSHLVSTEYQDIINYMAECIELYMERGIIDKMDTFPSKIGNDWSARNKQNCLINDPDTNIKNLTTDTNLDTLAMSGHVVSYMKTQRENGLYTSFKDYKITIPWKCPDACYVYEKAKMVVHDGPLMISVDSFIGDINVSIRKFAQLDNNISCDKFLKITDVVPKY